MLRKLLLTASLLMLMLASCTRHQTGVVTLIFENAPLQNRFTYPSGMYKPWKGKQAIKYVNSEGVLCGFETTGGYDTLRLVCPPSGIELQHRYKAIGFYTCLLQADDTVRVTYSPEGVPHFASSRSSRLTLLYNFSAETVKEPANHLGISALSLLKDSYTWMLPEANTKGSAMEANYISTDSLLANLNIYRQRYAAAIDSLKQLGLLPSAYERYFRFQLEQLQWDAYLAIQNYNPSPPASDQKLLGYLKDDYIPYTSYWASVSAATNHVVMRLEGKTIPTVEVEDSFGDKKRFVSRTDYRALYDTLADDKLLPIRTRNLMLSFTLRSITNNFPDDVEAYKEKYAASTNDFLEITKIPLKRQLPFAARFFLFLLESTLCSLIFYPLYRYWMRSDTTFISNRLYLLLSVLLSVVIPLVSLPLQLHVPVVLKTADKLSEIGSGSWTMVLVVLYATVALYCTHRLWSQLIFIRRLYKDSWRIPQKGYTLGLLQSIMQHPCAFGHMVFYAYNSYMSQPDARDKIIAHERYHVRMLHSVDNVLLTLFSALCWINPFLKYYQRELRAQHEYAADRAVVKKFGIRDYLLTLINTDPQLETIRKRLLPLYSNQVNDASYVQRLAMLQQKASPWRNGLKLLTVIPIAAMLIILFSSEPTAQIKEFSKTTLSS